MRVLGDWQRVTTHVLYDYVWGPPPIWFNRAKVCKEFCHNATTYRDFTQLSRLKHSPRNHVINMGQTKRLGQPPHMVRQLLLHGRVSGHHNHWNIGH